MSLKSAIKVAIFGVTLALLIDLANSWYISDLLMTLKAQGKTTVSQLLLYSRGVTTVKNVIQSASLVNFLYALQCKIRYFGSYDL